MGNNKDYGYILLWRSFFRGKFWRERRVFSKAEAWLDLFSSANFSNQEEMVGNTTFNVNRGEIMASVRFLGERWMWTTSKVHRFLVQLKKEGMIKTRTPPGTQQTIISISKYDEYNTLPDKVEHPVQQQWNTPETPDETNRNKERSKATAGNDKERVLSVINSFRAHAHARVSADEIHSFYVVFFFRNFRHPAYEVERFVNHYEADGWKRKSGAGIKNKIALAENWEEKGEGPVRFPSKFLAAWEDIYEWVKTRNPDEALDLLYEIRAADHNIWEKVATVDCSKKLPPIIRKYSQDLEQIWHRHLPQTTLRYGRVNI